MRQLNSCPASGKVHITSAAPGSMDQTYHKIFASIKSDSIPRGCESGSTTTGAGLGRESLPGAQRSDHARLSIALFSPSKCIYSPDFARLSRRIRSHHEHLACPDPSRFHRCASRTRRRPDPVHNPR
jgi:hypothetical protein